MTRSDGSDVGNVRDIGNVDDARDASEMVVADVVESLEFVWSQIVARRAGLTDAEYVWEPVPGCWSVRAASGGGAAVDGSDDDPEPAPVTTIAWREWHIAVDCLDSYSQRLFDRTGAGIDGRSWVLDPDDAGRRSQAAFAVFRDGVASAGAGWLFQALGEHWGPYAESTRLAMLLHAQHEIAHHGAEIGLLRDLWQRRDSIGA